MMDIMTPSEFRALLRLDFYAFCQKCFHELYPEAIFLPNWHLEVLAAKLDAARCGEILRLILNLPPRGLKSLCASTALPAFWLGHDPTAQILCVSYGQDLSEKLARDCRRIMASSWYQVLFPTRLSPEKQAVSEFETTAGGFRMATSVEGVITGRGADVIIIDDPQKPEEALSDARRRATNEWFGSTLRSRLNDKKKGCLILVMQRVHEDDLVGHVIAREDWEVVSFPAIALADEEHVIENISGKQRFTRRAGEPLHAEREPLEVLGALRRSLGEYHFAAQYLQVPAPLEGGIVKRAWFKPYTSGEEPRQFDYVVQSWDTANKFTELANYSACVTIGVKEDQHFLLNVFRRKMNFAELKRTIPDHARLWRAGHIVIEDKASGTSLIDELIHENRVAGIERYEPKGDKVMRLVAQTATLEGGFVWVPKDAPWLEDFLQELTTFPAAKYDDQVDAIAQALDWIKRDRNKAGMGVFQYYRKLYEEQQ